MAHASVKEMVHLDHLGPDELFEEPKEIWILGNFWITQAVRKARKHPDRENLGLDQKQFTVRWMCKPTLFWKDLILNLKESVSKLGAPSIVFIHAGSSDLGLKKYQQFKSQVKADLSDLSKSYPDTAFIWSIVLPIKNGFKGFKLNLEDRRKEFNSEVSVCAKECGFQVASLTSVEKMCAEKYSKKTGSYSWNFVHGVLNTYIKEALEKEIKKIKGAD